MKSPWRSAVLVAFAAAVLLRAPRLITDPRFWTEEGFVYFQDACDRGLAALWAPQMDYYSLVMNGAAQLARTVPLESAPLMTTLVALAVQMLPPALILWSRHAAFRANWSRLAAVAIVLLTPYSGYVWLNAVTSQFHLSLAAFLVLLEPTENLSRARRWTLRGVLLVAGLGGPPTALLAPVFACVALRERMRERVVHAAIVCSAAAVQLGLVVLAAIGREGPSRFAGVRPPTLALAVAVKSVVLPWCGGGVAGDLHTWLSRTGGENGVAFQIAGWGVVVLGAMALARVARGLPGGPRTAWAFVSVAFLSAAMSAGSGLAESKFDLLVPAFQQRYFYVPSVVLLLLVLLAAQYREGETRLPVRTWMARGIIALALVAGAREYIPSMRPFTEPSFPSWRAEVAHWRTDPTYEPRIWPPHFRVRPPR